MSADWSSDEDSRELAGNQVYDVHSQIYDPQSQVKCWECGKTTRNLTTLMEHYKSHNIKATCHICRVTFRRLISLSTHMDNAHSPPLCKVCNRTFSNMWELNKHAETHCVDAEAFREGPTKGPASDELFREMTVEQNANSPSWGERSQIKLEEHHETAEQGVEFIVGDDEDTDVDVSCGRTSSSESDVDVKTEFEPENSDREDRDDPDDAGSDSSSTGSCSSGSSSDRPSQTTSSHKNTVCAACGRGPFRSIKLHLLHCNGKKKEYRCLLCKLVFRNEWSLKRHLMYLFTCQVCSQVFSHQGLWDVHPCPKGSNSPLVSFCSEMMPKVCKICKCFFTSEKTLSAHVNRVHMSVVSTKVCIVTDLSLLTDRKVPAGAHNARNQLAEQAFNGKLRAGQTYARPASVPAKSSPSSPHPDALPVPVCLIAAAAPAKAEAGSAPVSSTNQPPTSASPPPRTPRGDTTPGAAAPEPARPPSASILALFENDYHDAALRRRSGSWRAKAPYPCRQCGASLRQPSLIIGHRYLHRGKRPHRCQCGRAFKHRLHLLRHCVQHAEAVSYICVSCGNTFTGAKLLARHLRGKSPTKCGRKGKRKCRMTFTCDCGLQFFRPSAYIWHQLKNRTKQ